MMIKLRLQMFGGGGLPAYKGGGGGRQMDKLVEPKEEKAKPVQEKVEKKKETKAEKKAKARYDLYSIRDGKTRLYQTGMTQDDLKEILGGKFKMDPKTGTIVTKSGKRYRLTKTKNKTTRRK